MTNSDDLAVAEALDRYVPLREDVEADWPDLLRRLSIDAAYPLRTDRRPARRTRVVDLTSRLWRLTGAGESQHRRRLRFVATVALTAAGAAVALAGLVFVTTRETGTSHATSLTPAQHNADVTNVVRQTVRSSVGVPRSPLAPDAADHVRNLFTPADPELPAFFTVPTKDGGSCIVTSNLNIGSCLSTREPSVPGTISISDDFEGDERPPLVYGQLRPSVKSVEVTVAGRAYAAGLAPGFYLFELPDASMQIRDVASVTFTLDNGQRVKRVVNG